MVRRGPYIMSDPGVSVPWHHDASQMEPKMRRNRRMFAAPRLLYIRMNECGTRPNGGQSYISNKRDRIVSGRTCHTHSTTSLSTIHQLKDSWPEIPPISMLPLNYTILHKNIARPSSEPRLSASDLVSKHLDESAGVASIFLLACYFL
jgi:hypothetical protein